MTDSLFGSNSSPYASFLSPGTNYQGVITALGQVQSRKFKRNPDGSIGQGDLEWWPDSTPQNPKPKMTAIITVQTDLRDPSIEGDDGQRSVWVKGKSMTDCVKAGIKAAGASREGLRVGGWFSITFTHETPSEFAGSSPTKHYVVEYRPPMQSDAVIQQGYSQAQQQASNTVMQPGPVQAGNAIPQGYSQAQQTVPQPVAQPVVQQPVDGAADPFANLTPEARAAVQAMLAQQAGQQ